MKEVEERIRSLSDIDLLNMLNRKESDYTPQAWKFACEELLNRGGKETVEKKISHENIIEIEKANELKHKVDSKIPQYSKDTGFINSYMWIVVGIAFIYLIWNIIARTIPPDKLLICSFWLLFPISCQIWRFLRKTRQKRKHFIYGIGFGIFVLSSLFIFILPFILINLNIIFPFISSIFIVLLPIVASFFIAFRKDFFSIESLNKDKSASFLKYLGFFFGFAALLALSQLPSMLIFKSYAKAAHKLTADSVHADTSQSIPSIVQKTDKQLLDSILTSSKDSVLISAFREADTFRYANATRRHYLPLESLSKPQIISLFNKAIGVEFSSCDAFFKNRTLLHLQSFDMSASGEGAGHLDIHFRNGNLSFVNFNSQYLIFDEGKLKMWYWNKLLPNNTDEFKEKEYNLNKLVEALSRIAKTL